MLFVLIIVSLSILIWTTEITYRDKVSEAFEEKYIVSLSRLPNFALWTNDYDYYHKLLNDIEHYNNLLSKSLHKGCKLSVKIRQLGKEKTEQIMRFKDLVKLAKSKKIFVWISCVLPEDRELEMKCFIETVHYGNVGITLATYHSDVIERMKKVLSMNGHIRLVKGYYYGDLSKNWNIVTNNYRKCAKFLIKDGKYHCLATHDFNILCSLYNDIIENRQVEVAFFYKSKDFANYEIKRRNLTFPMKSLYLPSGKLGPYIISNIQDIDKKRILQRWSNGILNNFVMNLKYIRLPEYLNNLDKE